MSDVEVDKPARQEGQPASVEHRPRWLSAPRDAFLQRREASVLLVALGLVIYFRASSGVFLTHDNLVNIAQASAPGAIVAVGIVLLLVSGEIDLSVGMVFALAPFLMHYAVDFYSVPVIPAILLSLAIAAGIGLINGLIVVKLRVPSFVATLGTFYVLQGIVLTTSHAYPAEIPAAARGPDSVLARDPATGRSSPGAC